MAADAVPDLKEFDTPVLQGLLAKLVCVFYFTDVLIVERNYKMSGALEHAIPKIGLLT